MTSRLFATGDVDKMMEYMAEDVKLINPGAALLVGNHHEKEGLEEARDTEGLDMSFEPTGAEISSSGDMAFAYGETSGRKPADRKICHYLEEEARQVAGRSASKKCK